MSLVIIACSFCSVLILNYKYTKYRRDYQLFSDLFYPELAYLIAKLREAESILERERIARSLITQRCSRQNSLFLEYFIELQKYLPFDSLIAKLKDYDSNADYNKFYNYVIFWSLEDTHPLKITIHENFPINEIFTGVELTDRFNAIYSGLLNCPQLTPKQAIPIIRNFCTLSDRTSKRINGRPVMGYRIIDTNPYIYC